MVVKGDLPYKTHRADDENVSYREGPLLSLII